LAPEDDLASPFPWRRSQRASADRRARLARTRRSRLRGRTCVLLAVALTGVAAGGALAADGGAPASSASAPALRSTTVRALQQKLGITADGVYGPRTRAAVRRFQRRHGLDVDGIAGPQTLAALGLRSASSGRSAGSPTKRLRSTTSATLARIAACESGGDPTAVSSGGQFRGKYQFTVSTWRAMGGKGDPAKASEAEQDRRAAKLLAASGTSPWPVCGA
jgi:Transglycosylase-like domain/Putative peptidoglycan binding domain